MGKLLVLALNEQEEKIIDKIIETLSDYISLEAVQTFPASDISFSGLEIRQHQRRVLRNGKGIKLTRLEYGTLVFLLLTQTGYSRSHKSLKPFGTWIVIAAIQALST